MDPFSYHPILGKEFLDSKSKKLSSQVSLCMIHLFLGAISAESLRFTEIGLKTNRSRDEIEAALKDIIHALSKVLKRESYVVLSFPFGKLHFQNKTIKMRYNF
jgi:hypothetical protein